MPGPSWKDRIHHFCGQDGLALGLQTTRVPWLRVHHSPDAPLPLPLPPWNPNTTMRTTHGPQHSPDAPLPLPPSLPLQPQHNHAHTSRGLHHSADAPPCLPQITTRTTPGPQHSPDTSLRGGSPPSLNPNTTTRTQGRQSRKYRLTLKKKKVVTRG